MLTSIQNFFVPVVQQKGSVYLIWAYLIYSVGMAEWRFVQAHSQISKEKKFSAQALKELLESSEDERQLRLLIRDVEQELMLCWDRDSSSILAEDAQLWWSHSQDLQAQLDQCN